MYLNVYATVRLHGGPEEGGWSYEAGEPELSVNVGTDFTVEGYFRRWRLNELTDAELTIFNLEAFLIEQFPRATSYRGDSWTVRFEDAEAASYPLVAPVYS